MKIFVKNGADMLRQMTKEVSQVSSRRELVDNIKSAELRAKGLTINGQPTTLGTRDLGEARRELAKWKKQYERTAPETLAPEVKNAMLKRAKALKDSFTIGMLSRDELHPVRKFVNNGTVITVVDEEKMNSLRSVERQCAWDKKHGAEVREFKNIMRHLCPDNPKFSDIERFRPVRRTK